jgi:hypothetical protein
MKILKLRNEWLKKLSGYENESFEKENVVWAERLSQTIFQLELICPEWRWQLLQFGNRKTEYQQK